MTGRRLRNPQVGGGAGGVVGAPPLPDSPSRGLDAREARAVAVDLLSRKAWTRRELAARLRRRGAPAEVAETVVVDLEARGSVDDRAFAVAWAESRARARGLGPGRLRDELLRKGVARPVVEQAVRAAFAETDEAARAEVAAARRWATLVRDAPEQAARRLHDYLLRRGFAADVARRAVRRTAGVPLEEP